MTFFIICPEHSTCHWIAWSAGDGEALDVVMEHYYWDHLALCPQSIH